MLKKYLVLIILIFTAASAAFAQTTTSLTLGYPGHWGHLSYTITGATLDAPTGSDPAGGRFVGGRQYKGFLTGNTLTVSGNAISDNTSGGPGSGDYYELVVTVTAGKQNKEYSYIAPKGEKLSKPFSLSVPIDPGATSGGFSIRLIEQNANYGPHGWAVSGSLRTALVTGSSENGTRVIGKVDVAFVSDVSGRVTVDSGKDTYDAEVAGSIASGYELSCGIGATLSVIDSRSQIEYVARCPGKLLIGDEGVSGDVAQALPLNARLPGKLDLLPRNLADGSGKNVSNVRDTWAGQIADTNFSIDEPVNRLIISNGRIGLVEVTRSGNGYTGRMNVNGKGWETLRNVTLDSGTITFDRGTVPIEKYVGKFANGSITGTFSTGGNGTRPWKAVILKAAAKGSEALLKQGAALATGKKYDEAIKAFDKALAIDPNNSDALRQRAVAKRELKDLAGSIEDFNNLIRIDPTNERAWVGRGITKERMKDVAGALADYDHLIALDPTYALPHYYRGNIRLNQEDYQAALADFNRMIELEPTNYAAFNNRGLAREGLGDIAGAIADYKSALTLDPKDEIATKNLARLRASQTTAKAPAVPVAPKPRPTASPTAALIASQEKTVFDSVNGSGVGNQPTAPATFNFRQPHVITSIMTYHWNDGRGTRAGTIALRDAAGRLFGPWRVAGSPGQGGVPNAVWIATPNVTLPAGEYTIIDSEPSTWSQNSASGNRGMSAVKGYLLLPTHF